MVSVPVIFIIIMIYIIKLSKCFVFIHINTIDIYEKVMIGVNIKAAVSCLRTTATTTSLMKSCLIALIPR